MPGTFTALNKVRPGVYTNIVGEPTTISAVGERGIAALPLILSWGDEKTIIEIESLSDFKDKLGYTVSDSELLLVREAFKRALKVLVYRVNTGVDATVTTGNLTATAKYSGTRGNDITIVITQNVDETTFDVQTLVDGIVEDEQLQKATVEDLEDNAWVLFTGTGALALTAGSNLTGGTDGTASASDYTDFLDALVLVDFNTVGYPGTDAGIKTAFDIFINDLRENQGVRAQCVLTDYDGDYEGIINVTNGVVLDDSTLISADQAVAWVTGATSAANVNESLTYQAYDGAVDANPRRTNSDTITRLQNGEFMFTAKNGKAIVEQDINSLVTIPSDKNIAFKKNRVIRVLDGLYNDTSNLIDENFIGKVSNNEAGQDRLKTSIIALYNEYLALEAIKNFDASTDIVINAGLSVGDTVVIDEYATPVDSIEKVYQTIYSRVG